MFCLNTYLNIHVCIHCNKGTNFGMKNHSAALKPTMGMDTSAHTLNLQSDIKAAEMDEIIFGDYKNSDKRWSSHPTAPYTTSFGEGLIKATYERSPLYTTRRVGDKSFQVMYGDDPNKNSVPKIKADFETEDCDDFNDVPIPLFERVREVTIDDNGVMSCECGRFECRGYFCEQQVCVAKAVYESSGMEFHGFTHHDIAARWRSAFMHYAYRKNTPKHLLAAFDLLARNEPTGPTLRVPIPNCMPIKERIPILPAADRLKNYDKSMLDLSILDGMFSDTFSPSTEFNLQNDELCELAQQIVCGIRDSTPAAAEDMFTEAVSNFEIATGVNKGVDSRTAMRPLVDTAFLLSDRLGREGLQKLEEMMSEYNKWASGRLSETKDADKNKKRKHVPLTQEEYEGTADRVLNTHHMSH